jgi:hypothetical protein
MEHPDLKRQKLMSGYDFVLAALWQLGPWAAALSADPWEHALLSASGDFLLFFPLDQLEPAFEELRAATRATGEESQSTLLRLSSPATLLACGILKQQSRPKAYLQLPVEQITFLPPFLDEFVQRHLGCNAGFSPLLGTGPAQCKSLGLDSLEGASALLATQKTPSLDDLGTYASLAEDDLDLAEVAAEELMAALHAILAEVPAADAATLDLIAVPSWIALIGTEGVPYPEDAGGTIRGKLSA